MQIFDSLSSWQAFRKNIPVSTTIGFVPTMGNLHQGHISLVKQSQAENSLTVVSIFINPTQFNQPEDYQHYPRTLEADLALLEANGVNYCLLPSSDEIYHDKYRYQISASDQNEIMEGKMRPGHFTGVLTVVMKLLQLVKPQRAYFGEKDYQQLALIKGMVKAFFMDIDIIPCTTVRENSQLACSSRNNRLTTKEREIADDFAKIFHDLTLTPEMMLLKLQAQSVEVEYLEEHYNRRFIAVKIGNIRLIDNYALTLPR